MCDSVTSTMKSQRKFEDRVAVKVELLRELDRAVEKRAVELDIPKRQFIEDAIRVALSLERRETPAQ